MGSHLAGVRKGRAAIVIIFLILLIVICIAASSCAAPSCLFRVLSLFLLVIVNLSGATA